MYLLDLHLDLFCSTLKGQTTFIYIFTFALKNDRGTTEQQLDFIMVAFLQVGVISKYSRSTEVTTIFFFLPEFVCYEDF